MLDHRSAAAHRPRRSVHPPFARILCALDGGEADEAAIRQATAVADGDARITCIGAWTHTGSEAHAVTSEHRARAAIVEAVARTRDAGVEADFRLVHGPTLADAVLGAEGPYDLVVVGAPPHARLTGIVLGETATRLAHSAQSPVLIAREPALDGGVVAGTRAVPDDRFATTAAAHVAARAGAELIVVHVPGRDASRRRPELRSELANARALLGRELDFLKESGNPARALVSVAQDEGAGLIVVGSTGRRGLPALASVSERVAQLAPCSVLIMRCR
jgi:nucleotide-binding universal stress UspA family protein